MRARGGDTLRWRRRRCSPPSARCPRLPPSRAGVTFARNLGAKNNYKFSVAQTVVDVATDGNKVVLVTPAGKAAIKGGVKGAEAAVNALSNTTRPDLRVTLLKKYSQLKRSSTAAVSGSVKTGRTSSLKL
jgi:hypothetical protein